LGQGAGWRENFAECWVAKEPEVTILRTWGAACCAPTVMGLVLELKQMRPPLGIGGLEKARFVASVVFTPAAWGHPS